MSDGVCTACGLHPRGCDLTFVCTRCKRRLNVCECLVGGFARLGHDEMLCSHCYDEEHLSADYLARLRDKRQVFKLSYRARGERQDMRTAHDLEQEGVE